jgi:hypothetical protein
MPYIKQSDREELSSLVEDMYSIGIDNPGELNYLVTQLVHAYLSGRAPSYQAYNDVLGALEGAKLELYSRSIRKYEDEKIAVNGDVP